MFLYCLLKEFSGALQGTGGMQGIISQYLLQLQRF
jgi:hypothetical protein